MSANRATGTGRHGVGVAREVVDLARREEIGFLAAAIAYYALVSVVPALVLGLAAATSVGGVALAERTLEVAGGLLTPAGQAVVEDALLGGDARPGATVLGLVVLAWGALKGFRGLDTAFSRVYGTTGRDSLVDRFRDAAVGLVAVGAAFGAMVVLGGVLAALPVPPVGWVGGLASLLVGLFLAFLPLYALFPDAEVGLAEAAPGAALAAVGWVALQAGFQAYAAMTSLGDLYGLLGGVLLLVTWFYVAAIVLLAGAVLNAVLAGRAPTGDRQAEEPAGRGTS